MSTPRTAAYEPHTSDSDSDCISMLEENTIEVMPRKSSKANTPADTTKKGFSAPRRMSRITSLCLGFGILAAVVLGLYFFLRDNSLQKPRSSSSTVNENYQGTIALSTLEVHNQEEDCWLAIYDEVYDLTEYAPTHPGGPEYVWDFCGMNATKDYDREHAKVLLDLIPETRMGTYIGDQEEEVVTEAPQTEDEPDEQDPTEDDTSTTTEESTPVDTSATSEEEKPEDTTPQEPKEEEEEEDKKEEPKEEDEKEEEDKQPDKTEDTVPTTTTPDAPTRSPTTPAPTAIRCYEQFYALDEVALHSEQEDCWYVLYDNVYDLTDYVDIHPGGARRIFQECGTDATAMYESEKGHDQSLLQEEGMGKYKIGTFGTTSGELQVACPPMCAVETIALADVQLHDTVDDCWYVLYDTVYDLTEYVDIHPGGARRIFQECGTDATDVYVNEKKHNQALLQKEGMSKYEIGSFGSKTGTTYVPC